MKKKNIPYPKDWQLPDFYCRQFRQKSTKYCVCIPIINEGEKFRTQIIKMAKFAKRADIIIADGGSTDGSTDETFLEKNNVRTLLVKKSQGKQGTQLRMAFAYAIMQGYKGIITIDGNGKDGIHALPLFIKALDTEYDCISGSRFIKGGKATRTPVSRLFGIRFLASPLLSISARRWLTDVTNGFMGYSRNYLLHPKVKPFREIFVGYELLFYLKIRASQLEMRTTEIPVTRQYPKSGTLTKVAGWNGNREILKIFLKLVMRFYDPQ